jgi:hypothetical protein
VRAETRNLIARIALVAALVFVATPLIVLVAPLFESGRLEGGVIQ